MNREADLGGERGMIFATVGVAALCAVVEYRPSRFVV